MKKPKIGVTISLINGREITIEADSVAERDKDHETIKEAIEKDDKIIELLDVVIVTKTIAMFKKEG